MKELTKLGQSFVDPFDRRRLEDLVAAPPETIELLTNGIHPSLGLDQRLAEGLAPPAVTDEVQEVREASLL